MRKLFVWFCVLGYAASAWAAEEAYTIRATELKAKPYSDAQTLVTLPERSKVVVLQRRASWTQVRAGETAGWVKMLSIQLARGSSERRADNGLRSLFNVARSGGSGATVTTGVRGLSEEQLKNTRPDPQALEKARRYAASKVEAKRFAAEGKLKSQQVDYFAAGGGR
ncbi:hypothetical protein UT4_14370 [Ferrigenium sp. UT4]